MRLSFLSFSISLCIHGATAAVVRKQPAFATPIYSDAYLPASMQVIFNIVDQLKRIEAEEVEQNLLSTPSTSPHPPGQKQPLPTTPTIGTGDEIETASVPDEEKYYIPPERYQEEALIISRPDDEGEEGVADYEKIAGGEVTPEVNHEESEVVYGVPETNFELPESNHEIPEDTDVNMSEHGTPLETIDKIAGNCDHEYVKKKPDDKTNNCKEFHTNSEFLPSDATTSAVDSVVKEIYSIIKTSSLNEKNLSSISKDDNLYGKSSANESLESKNSAVNSSKDKLSDDEEKSNERIMPLNHFRYMVLGERIDQAPRPSLMSFLRATNATSSPSLRQLGELYDALSKDARRQGFSKFAGYSKKVLETLQESSGGGAGVQLKELLEKVVANKELTRYEAMEKTKEIITVLKDRGSKLSTDLRQLLPLRFMA